MVGVGPAAAWRPLLPRLAQGHPLPKANQGYCAVQRFLILILILICLSNGL